jgi:hypothetical protein
MTDLNISDIVIKYYNERVENKDYENWAESNFFVIENLLGSDDTSKGSSSDDDIIEEFYNTYMNKSFKIWYDKMIELFPNLTDVIITHQNDASNNSDVSVKEDISDEASVKEDISDDVSVKEDISDKVSDIEVSDNEVSDEEVSDNEVSDIEVSDEEVSDNEVSDEEVSDNEVSDEEVSDNLYELPSPVKIIIHSLSQKQQYKYIMVGNLIDNDSLKSVFKQLENTQLYDSLTETQINTINSVVSYYDIKAPGVKISYKNAWGNINKDEYEGIKFINASINYMYDTFRDLSNIIFATCRSKFHTPLVQDGCFYYVKIKNNVEYIKTHLLLSIDIENGENKDIVFQKIQTYLNDMNCPSKIIENIQTLISTYSYDTITDVYGFLNQLFDNIGDDLSYTQLGYFYKTRKYDNTMYISTNPHMEYSLNMLNTTLSDKAIYKNNPFQIIAELPILDNNIHIIQVNDIINILKKNQLKINNEFISNYLAYYFPQIRTQQRLTKLLDAKNEEPVDTKINDKILKTNNRETLSSQIHSYITKNHIFKYKSSNTLYIDVTSYIKRSNNIPLLDLLYIFNTIDLNNIDIDIENEKYQAIMASYLDPISNKIIYKIHSPTWDELNLIEETTKMHEKTYNSHIKDILLKLIKYNKVSVNIDEVKYIPSKPKGLLYKFNLGFYISRYNEIYNGVIENVSNIGTYRKIYEVNIGHKKLGIIHQCILNKVDNKIYKKGDRIQFVPFEALSVRTFTLIIDKDYKVNIWIYGSRSQSINSDELESYLKVVNSFLKYINNMTTNFQRHLQLFPTNNMVKLSNMGNYINSTTYINDISLHNTLSISCPDGSCSNQIRIEDLNRLKNIIRSMFHMYFDIEDDIKKGTIVYYKKNGKGNMTKAEFIGIINGKYNIKLINKSNKGNKGNNQITCDRYELITDLKNEFQVKLTYKKVTNYVYLTPLEKKMKYYAERIMSSQNIIMNLINENRNLDENNVQIMYNDFLGKHRSILHKNVGVNVILDFSKFNSIDDISHLDIYFENIQSITCIPFIKKILQTLMFVFYNFTEKIGLGNIGNVISDDVSNSDSNNTTSSDSSDSRNSSGDDLNEDEVDDDIDANVNLKDMDEYNYLMLNIKDLNTSNDLLSRLNEFESKISNTGYTSTCTNRYPLVLSKKEVNTILNREQNINDINKQRIQKYKHEIHIRPTEKVFVENKTNKGNKYELVNVSTVNNNNTIDYIVGPNIDTVGSSYTQLKSQSRQINEINISMAKIQKQIYYMDDVYVDTDKSGRDNDINMLVHSVVKNILFAFPQNHPKLKNLFMNKVSIRQDNTINKGDKHIYLIGISENEITKIDTRKYSIYYSETIPLQSYIENNKLKPIRIMRYKCNDKTHIIGKMGSHIHAINVYDLMER